LCYQNFGKFSQKIAKLVEFKTGKKNSNIFSFSLSKNSKEFLGKNKTNVEQETLILGIFFFERCKNEALFLILRVCFDLQILITK